MPHLFTIFSQDSHWYIDVFTHSNQYKNIPNYLLYEKLDFFKASKAQYIARFQLKLPNNNLPEIWRWYKFIDVSKHSDNIEKYRLANNYFNQYYKLNQTYNKQFFYRETGIIYRKYN